MTFLARKFPLVLLAALLPLSPARGEGTNPWDIDISGSVEVQARAFWQNPAWVLTRDT